MKYKGAKRSVLVHKLLRSYASQYDNYYDLLCGGANAFLNVADAYKGRRVMNDYYPYLIAYFERLMVGWNEPFSDNIEFVKTRINAKSNSENFNELREKFAPPFISEKEHTKIKKAVLNGTISNYGYDAATIGWATHALTAFGTYLGIYPKNKRGEDYYSQTSNVAIREGFKLFELQPKIFNLDYQNVPIAKNSLIYCDIPYSSSANYTGIGKFDYERFYKWCIRIALTKPSCKLLISEYYMPENYFTPILVENTGDKNRTYFGNKRKQEVNDCVWEVNLDYVKSKINFV